MNKHMADKAVNALLPWTKKGNMEAWETTEHLLWAKGEPTDEQNIFEEVVVFAQKAQELRNKGGK